MTRRIADKIKELLPTALIRDKIVTVEFSDSTTNKDKQNKIIIQSKNSAVMAALQQSSTLFSTTIIKDESLGMYKMVWCSLFDITELDGVEKLSEEQQNQITKNIQDAYDKSLDSKDDTDFNSVAVVDVDANDVKNHRLYRIIQDLASLIPKTIRDQKLLRAQLDMKKNLIIFGHPRIEIGSLLAAVRAQRKIDPYPVIFYNSTVPTFQNIADEIAHVYSEAKKRNQFKNFFSKALSAVWSALTPEYPYAGNAISILCSTEEQVLRLESMVDRLTQLEIDEIKQDIFNTFKNYVESYENTNITASKAERNACVLIDEEKRIFSSFSSIQIFNKLYPIVSKAEVFSLRKSNHSKKLEEEAHQFDLSSLAYAREIENYIKEKTAKNKESRTTFVWNLATSADVMANPTNTNLKLMQKIYQWCQKDSFFSRSGLKGYKKGRVPTMKEFVDGATEEHKGDRRYEIYNGLKK